VLKGWCEDELLLAAIFDRDIFENLRGDVPPQAARRSALSSLVEPRLANNVEISELSLTRLARGTWLQSEGQHATFQKGCDLSAES
jgi:hypothetical protein